MLHLAEEQNAILEAQNKAALRNPIIETPFLSRQKEIIAASPNSSIIEVSGRPVEQSLGPTLSSMSLTPINPTPSCPGLVEPTSITLELLGINPHQGKKFVFSDVSDEIEDDSPKEQQIMPNAEIDSGPSQHEEEAFEDA